MLAGATRERHALAKPQAAHAQLEDAADRRRWTERFPVVVRQFQLGIVGQQPRVADVTIRQQPVGRLRNEVKGGKFKGGQLHFFFFSRPPVKTKQKNCDHIPGFSSLQSFVTFD